MIFRRGPRGMEVLLVYEAQGKAQGWDLPGGDDEPLDAAGCQTAERETCEETSHLAKAVKPYTKHIFRCEIVKLEQCCKERSLRKHWYTLPQIEEMKDFRFEKTKVLLARCMKDPVKSGCFSSQKEVDSLPRRSSLAQA